MFAVSIDEIERRTWPDTLWKLEDASEVKVEFRIAVNQQILEIDEREFMIFCKGHT